MLITYNRLLDHYSRFKLYDNKVYFLYTYKFIALLNLKVDRVETETEKERFKC